MESVVLETRVGLLETIADGLAKVTTSNSRSLEDVINGQQQLTDIVNLIANGLSKQFDEQIKGIQISVNSKINGIEGKIDKLNDTIDNECIDGIQISQLEKERRKRAIHLLGGKTTDKYKIFGSAYFATIGEDIKYEFKSENGKLTNFGHIKKVQFNGVIDFIHTWYPIENKIEKEVMSDMFILRDNMLELKELIDKNKLSESDKLVKAVEINKNEKKLKLFDRYMNKKYSNNTVEGEVK